MENIKNNMEELSTLSYLLSEECGGSSLQQRDRAGWSQSGTHLSLGQKSRREWHASGLLSGWQVRSPHPRQEEWARWQRGPAPEHTQSISASPWTSWKGLGTIWVSIIIDGSRATEMPFYPLLHYDPIITSRMAWPREIGIITFLKKECDGVIKDGSYLGLACGIWMNKRRCTYVYEP